jgi:hypothetical protein
MGWALMDRVRRFLGDRGPRVPTQRILDKFRDVPDHEAAIFKAILKEVATLERGAWTLKDDYAMEE